MVPPVNPERAYEIEVVVAVVDSTDEGVGVKTVQVERTPLEVELLDPQQNTGVVVRPLALTAPFKVTEDPDMSDGDSVIAVGLPATKFKIEPLVVPDTFEAEILK